MSNETIKNACCTEQEKNKKPSLESLSILYMPHLVFFNEQILILNFDGFVVEIEETDKFGFVCVATLNYFNLGKNTKRIYYLDSTLQLNRWLSCIRSHSRKMFIKGYTKSVDRIADSFDAEKKYIIMRLDEIAAVHN